MKRSRGWAVVGLGLGVLAAGRAPAANPPGGAVTRPAGAVAPPATAPAPASAVMSPEVLSPLLKMVEANEATGRPAGGEQWNAELVRVRADLGDLRGADAAGARVRADSEVMVAGELFALRAAKAGRDVAAEVRRQKLQFITDDLATAVVRAELRAGRLAEARAVANLFEPGGYGKGAWLSLARATGQRADFDRAVRMFRRPPDEYELPAVVEAQAACGDAAGAVKAAETIKVESVRSDALRRIARAQAHRGDVEGARATAGRVDRQSVNDFNLAWASVAAGLAAKGDTAATREALANVVKTMDYGPIVAVEAYPLARAGDVAGAKAVAERLKAQNFYREQSVATAYALTARAQAERGDAAGARATLDELARWLAGRPVDEERARGVMRGLQAAMVGPRVVETLLTGIAE